MSFNLCNRLGKTIKIKILTLNDTYQTNYYGRWAQKALDIISAEQDPETIYVKVFGGDFLFPSKYSSIIQGHDMILASNSSDFDIIGIGNHEFDGGQPVLNELASMSNTPLLCSNLQPDVLERLNMKNNISFVKNDVKFGGVAFLTQDTPQLTTGAKGLVFENLDYVFDTQRDFLLSCDVRILAFHDDIQKIYDYLDTRPENKKLVDAIVCGNQHIVFADYIERPDYKIPVVEMGQDAFGIGYIELDYNKCFKCLTNSFVEVQLIPPTYPQTPEIQILTAWVEEISAPYFIKTIGVVKNYALNGLRNIIRTQEANMGDLVTDAYLYTGTSRIEAPEGNIFAITNSGSIRNNSIIPIDFNVTGETVYAIVPFANNVIALEIIGRSAVNSLLNYLATTSFSKRGSGGWLQISKNLVFNYQTKTYELTTGTQSETDPFYLLLTDFTANGGDGYTELIKYKRLAIDLPTQLSLIEYIEKPLDGIISYTNDYTRIILP